MKKSIVILFVLVIAAVFVSCNSKSGSDKAPLSEETKEDKGEDEKPSQPVKEEEKMTAAPTEPEKVSVTDMPVVTGEGSKDENVTEAPTGTDEPVTEAPVVTEPEPSAEPEPSVELSPEELARIKDAEAKTAFENKLKEMYTEHQAVKKKAWKKDKKSEEPRLEPYFGNYDTFALYYPLSYYYTDIDGDMVDECVVTKSVGFEDQYGYWYNHDCNKVRYIFKYDVGDIITLLESDCNDFNSFDNFKYLEIIKGWGPASFEYYMWNGNEYVRKAGNDDGDPERYDIGNVEVSYEEYEKYRKELFRNDLEKGEIVQTEESLLLDNIYYGEDEITIPMTHISNVWTDREYNVHIKWIKLDGITGYEIERRGSSEKKWEEVAKVKDIEYIDLRSESSFGKVLEYRIRAYVGDQNGTVIRGDYSNVEKTGIPGKEDILLKKAREDKEYERYAFFNMNEDVYILLVDDWNYGIMEYRNGEYNWLVENESGGRGMSLSFYPESGVIKRSGYSPVEEYPEYDYARLQETQVEYFTLKDGKKKSLLSEEYYVDMDGEFYKHDYFKGLWGASISEEEYKELLKKYVKGQYIEFAFKMLDSDNNRRELCSYSSTQLLDEADIIMIRENLGEDVISSFPGGRSLEQMLINEIFARHNHKFSDPELNKYFYGEFGYDDSEKETKKGEIEVANIKFLDR